MNLRLQTSFLFGKGEKNYIKKKGKPKRRVEENIQQSHIIKGRAECVCVWLVGGDCGLLFGDGAG